MELIILKYNLTHVFQTVLEISCSKTWLQKRQKMTLSSTLAGSPTSIRTRSAPRSAPRTQQGMWPCLIYVFTSGWRKGFTAELRRRFLYMYWVMVDSEVFFLLFFIMRHRRGKVKWKRRRKGKSNHLIIDTNVKRMNLKDSDVESLHMRN